MFRIMFQATLNRFLAESYKRGQIVTVCNDIFDTQSKIKAMRMDTAPEMLRIEFELDRLAELKRKLEEVQKTPAQMRPFA